MASNNNNNFVEGADGVEGTDVVDLDASGILAMGSPGGSQPEPSQEPTGASLPPDAMELDAPEPLGPEIERLINEDLDDYLRGEPRKEPETTTESDLATSKEGEWIERKKRSLAERKKGEEEESAPRLNDSVPTFDEELGGRYVRDRRNQTERGREQLRSSEKGRGVKRSGTNREVEDGESTGRMV